MKSHARIGVGNVGLILIAALSAGILVFLAEAPAALAGHCLGIRTTIMGTAGGDVIVGTKGRDVIKRSRWRGPDPRPRRS